MQYTIENTNHGKAIGIIMTYNCSRMLEGLLVRIPTEALDEVIIVDDNSKDKDATQKIASKYKVQFFSHGHLGYGGNLKYGFQKAIERGADYMIEIHGDGQFDPTVIPQALEKLRQGADFVMGSRFTNWKQPLKDGMSLVRFIANILLSLFARFILKIKWTEFHGGFRAYSRKLVEKVGLDKGANNHLYSFQIITMARYRNLIFAEIPIRADYHGEHTSISLHEAAIYFFQTFVVLSQYVLARIGIKNHLFR